MQQVMWLQKVLEQLVIVETCTHDASLRNSRRKVDALDAKAEVARTRVEELKKILGQLQGRRA
jgi:hypothetical protein